MARFLFLVAALQSFFACYTNCLNAITPSDKSTSNLFTYPSLSTPFATSVEHAFNAQREDAHELSTTTSYTVTTSKTVSEYEKQLVDLLIVKIDPRNITFTVNWTFILQHVPIKELEALWNETDTSESLMTTLTRYNMVYKVDKDPIYIHGNGSYGMCHPFQGHDKVNFTSGIFPNSLVSYKKHHIGIRADQLWTQLFFYLSDVFKRDSINHNVFYSTRSNIVYMSVTFLRGKYQLVGIITKHWMYTTLIREETSNRQHTLTMLFGENGKLPSVKGYMTMDQMTVVRNDRFSLIIVSTFEDFAHIYNYFKPNWETVFKGVTDVSVKKLAFKLQTYLIMLIKNGGCEELRMDTDFITFFFEFIAMYFRFGIEVDAQKDHYLDFDCVINTLFELEITSHLMDLCFTSFYRRGFESNGISRTATALIAGMPIYEKDAFEITDREWFLKCLYFADSLPYISSKSIYGVTRIVLDIYTDYVKQFSLAYSDRKLLFYIYLAMSRFDLRNSTFSDPNLMLLYRLITSMCSASEISQNVEFWAKTHDLDIYKSFSPCYMSLRFDYTKEKLAIESMQDINLSDDEMKYGVGVMFGMLHGHFNKIALNNLVISKCITNPSKVKLVIPFDTCTFVISHDVVAYGKTYDVSDTFLKSSMVVTVVANERCIYDSLAKTTSKIPVVHNITRPGKHCIMCNSAILSYDEYDGIETVAFITSQQVQNYLFSDHSSFFDSQNMHTHYLLLMNNGTVIEIRGLYKGRAMNMIIILLFFIAFCAAMFLLYKIVYKLLY
ncbi:glycoprotein H [Porcine lymphotropic herpesvirus 2]|uniref:Glycoprotein H n=1 Tax=Suid gammaherpesvirus 4 TaxID=1960250 RepID=Q8B3W9_9GAMA|nr:glycoprotein H [Porcine lymphotropic herpesvirus 2]AAO12364.1 glycoprotein H [Porcine lymphotropic herpesvirus 2]